jgi:hypothetical protein
LRVLRVIGDPSIKWERPLAARVFAMVGASRTAKNLIRRPFPASFILGGRPLEGWGKGFAKRRAPMGVQVVLNQINLVSLRKVDVGQLFENMSIVDGGASDPNGDIEPALMRSEYYEQAGDTVAFVFIVRPRGLPPA